MFRGNRVMWLAALAMVICLGACSPKGGEVAGGEGAQAPEMPADWKVVSDFQVPAGQVKPMSENLGADLSSVRNTVYDVRGKRVQLNVLVAPNAESAEKLMAKLMSMKSAEALLRKDLIVYEFVGQNDVLPEIAEGRRHLDSK